jgi:hypothetical protein
MRLLGTMGPVVLFALAVPAIALGDGQDVITDCTNHGSLTRHYTQKEYTEALDELPADVDEYGDCRSIIRDAQLAAAGSEGGGGGDGGAAAGGATSGVPPVASASGTGGAKAGSVGGDRSGTGRGDNPAAIDPTDPAAANPTTPDEKSALMDAARHGGSAVKVGHDTIAPGAHPASFTTGLPTPLTGVLALLGIAALTGGAIALRRRLRRG